MSTCLQQTREEMPNPNQARVGTKPDPLYNLLDLHLDFRARMYIFQLPSKSKKANVEH
jgi:hypothetical protein